ncbi:MAG: endonuclease VII domain-containing protein [Bryobacteraceae bacterium]
MCSACYRRWWAAQNPERDRAIAKRSYERNKERDNRRSREYYQANRERLIALQKQSDERRKDEKREYNRVYQATHRRPEYHRSYKLQQLYGLTIKQYEAMYLDQGGLCAICGRAERGRGRNDQPMLLSVDHDHTTGQVRGLLCRQCNTALSYLEDDEWDASARAYLSAAASVSNSDRRSRAQD